MGATARGAAFVEREKACANMTGLGIPWFVGAASAVTVAEATCREGEVGVGTTARGAAFFERAKACANMTGLGFPLPCGASTDVLCFGGGTTSRVMTPAVRSIIRFDSSANRANDSDAEGAGLGAYPSTTFDFSPTKLSLNLNCAGSPVD